MEWFSGKNTWGNFPDLAGAVNKLQESVKTIEKNFDNALGFEENGESSTEGSWPLPRDPKALFNPVMAFMGNNDEESAEETSEKLESSQQESGIEKSFEKTDSPDFIPVAERKGDSETDNTAGVTTPDHVPVFERKQDFETDNTAQSITEESTVSEENEVVKVEADPEKTVSADETGTKNLDHGETEDHLPEMPVELSESNVQKAGSLDSVVTHPENETAEVETSSPLSMQSKPIDITEDQVERSTSGPAESHTISDVQETFQVETDEESKNKERMQTQESAERVSSIQPKTFGESEKIDEADTSVLHSTATEETESVDQPYKEQLSSASPSNESSELISELVLRENEATVKENEGDHVANDVENDMKKLHLSSVTNMSDSDSMDELERVKKEMKTMEATLQGAARQAQAKADEIAKLMNENEQLKAAIEDLKIKSNEAEIEYLREEYHQRVSTLERKVYALTKERDTLRREQNKKSDAAVLLKEKDEIITQVMAEGEELSKKQAAQESTIRKLRAQVRELEEEKKGLDTQLQVEENKVESIRRDKTATETMLQETIEKHETELAAQKDYYANALAAAKEAEVLAEARANNEARTELESLLREAEERESMLVHALEELRQTLTIKEQQAASKEDILRRDIEDLQKRYQASERRCEELVTQVPESTRPLLRQIEAMQEANGRKEEAWAVVERTLNSRHQEAEAKAAGAEERERSVNDRLSQTLSRINVVDAQISCLRAEQTQLSRTLEKERQRAAEHRQEYLAAKEEADTQGGRARQLEEEIKEIRKKHKQELQEALTHRELLQQEIEREKAARSELERTANVQSAPISDQTSITRQNSAFDKGNLSRKVASASSLASMEESIFLQASLDSSNGFSERRNPRDPSMSSYYMKSMTSSSYESALRQKEGELASYMSRLASMESIRDSLAEELVQMTEQCEKLRKEATFLPGLRAELEALRKRHSAALELMGERDEELEELRADIVDVKEMYREQVNMLVNKIQRMSSSVVSI
ncbi:putative TATA element modulatory factor 1 TATA binding, TATA element modulatory factor 1 DNA binding [Lupinus albus]|uniref:Putative TATA element modulatory factor 1 TATA binding, TATA element modulatory factor 1 DNA binding n=1 Tax=Lupinus albus TaxID=3870 RepID=A0A6A4QQ59_LUPAL|nr:putative TATA element modulatory factor 1 TATA binding, TATA element modulatory factor 1 DNA binding [Lupinus albus]